MMMISPRLQYKLVLQAPTFYIVLALLQVQLSGLLRPQESLHPASTRTIFQSSFVPQGEDSVAGWSSDTKFDRP